MYISFISNYCTKVQYVAETCRSIKITCVQWLEIKLVCERQLYGMCVTLAPSNILRKHRGGAEV